MRKEIPDDAPPAHSSCSPHGSSHGGPRPTIKASRGRTTHTPPRLSPRRLFSIVPDPRRVNRLSSSTSASVWPTPCPGSRGLSASAGAWKAALRRAHRTGQRPHRGALPERCGDDRGQRRVRPRAKARRSSTCNSALRERALSPPRSPIPPSAPPSGWKRLRSPTTSSRPPTLSARRTRISFFLSWRATRSNT